MHKTSQNDETSQNVRFLFDFFLYILSARVLEEKIPKPKFLENERRY